MNAKIVFVMLSVLLLLTACGKQAAPAPQPEATPEPTPAPTPAPETAPAVEQPPAIEDAAEDTTVSEIDSSTEAVDQLSKDLDTSVIDDIDVQLAELDKLELE